MTLTELIAAVRQRSDMENSEFVTDAEITSYINASYAELRDLLITVYEDYYISQTTATIATGNSFTLPSDFYKLRGLDLDNGGGDYIALRKFNFSDRNRTNRLLNRSIMGLSDKEYRVFGNTIIITPEQNATGSYRLYYIPTLTPLSAGTDVLDAVYGYEEYVVVDAAIKCLQKEESDVSVLFAQKQALTQRIQSSAQNRDVDLPETITDIWKRNSYWDDN